MTDLNPQAKQMADESMVRNLDAQARAIWPQEVELIRRYRLPDDIRILDAGCGTGEAAWRLAELFPRAEVLGVDIIDSHLELARVRHPGRARSRGHHGRLRGGRHGARAPGDLRHDPGSVARRLRGIGQRGDAPDAGAGEGLFRPDDRQYPRPPRLRGVDGSGGE